MIVRLNPGDMTTYLCWYATDPNHHLFFAFSVGEELHKFWHPFYRFTGHVALAYFIEKMTGRREKLTTSERHTLYIAFRVFHKLMGTEPPTRDLIPEIERRLKPGWLDAIEPVDWDAKPE